MIIIIPFCFLLILGKAVFASCPLDGSLASCASNPMSLSVDNGGDASFDAIVTHTTGGSCGFRQRITNVKLMKINREFGVSDELLLSCDTSMTTMCSNSRVSLSRGNDPGNEFVFTLTGTNINDSGMYEVVVDVIHPRSGSQGTITKKFHLNITARSRPVTTIAVETTSTTADQSSSGPNQGSLETSSTDSE